MNGNPPLLLTHSLLRACALALLLALTACATVPTSLSGRFASGTPADAISDGETIRWGGPIVATEPSASNTCLEILAKPLGANARPLARDQTLGRFLACRKGFVDPAVYAPGREVTVVGRSVGRASRSLGAFAYEVPKIEADVLYLWPERMPSDPRCIDPWHRGPWYGPGWWWWGPRHPFFWW